MTDKNDQIPQGRSKGRKPYSLTGEIIEEADKMTAKMDAEYLLRIGVKKEDMSPNLREALEYDV